MQGGAIDALVVGCPGKNLKGVAHGVDGMKEMLEARGFTVDVRTGDRATRAGILAGYDELIANVRRDKPTVFYYTGHGFYAFAPAESRSCQGICPTDIDENTKDDFRGITAWELSIKQAELTRRTRNVTVILDCCYASQMSRDAAANNAVARTLLHPLRVGFDAHLRALRTMYGAAFDAVDPLGNRDAVRVVACGQGETAFEYEAEDGTHRGALTEALLHVLSDVGSAPVSWAALESALRARVFDRFPSQTPAIDGPARRRLFSLDEDDVIGKPIVFAVRDGFEIGAGRLMGVTPGDVYAVMPSGAQTYSAEAAIAEVEVAEPSATVSQAVLHSWKNGHTELTQTAIAFPIKKQLVRRPVRLDVPDLARQRIEAEFAATAVLRPHQSEDKTALATLRLVDRSLTIKDGLGPLFPVTRFPEDLPDAAANLANLAAAQRLRELEGAHGVRADEVDIEWGTVEGGEPRPMPDRGGALGLRDRIYVKVKRKTQRQLYVHIFNIGLRGKITLVTRNISAAGVLLGDKTPEFVLGQNALGTLLGCSLSWPPGLPCSFPRIDELVVIVSSLPTDLQYLETQERITARGQESQTRGDMEAIDGFLMKRLSYLLHPREAAMADRPFEIDDDPLRQAGTLAPEVWLVPDAGRAPRAGAGTTIAVQLSNLVVDCQCAVGPVVRVDALICTRSLDQTSGYATWTRRYRCLVAGEDLIGDATTVFEGPVQDFVSICLWVSRDLDGSPDLATLFEQQATNPELRDAAGVLMSADIAAACAAGGGAVLCRMAHELLEEVVGSSPIRLYRTAFGAHDRFGAGRHPTAGPFSAQGISFSVTIATAGPVNQ